MRISNNTPQVINQQLANKDINNNEGISKDNISAGRLANKTNSDGQQTSMGIEKGTILSGILVNLSKQMATVKVNGTGVVDIIVEGNADLTHLLSEGISKEVRIEVTGTSPKLTGKILQEPLLANASTELETQLLQHLNLPVSENNLKAARYILAYQLEPTSAMIKTLVDGSISASMLSSFEEGALKQVPIETPLKEAILSLLKQKSNQVNGEPNSQKVAVTVPLNIQSGLNHTVELNIKADLSISGSSDSSSELDQIGQDMVDQQNQETIELGEKKSNNVQANNTGQNAVLKLTEALSRFDLEKAAVLQKTGLPFNIKNTVEAEKVLFGSHTLSKQLKHILQQVQTLEPLSLPETVIQTLKQIASEDSLQLNSQLNAVQEILESIQGQKPLESLHDLLNEFKNSLEFIKDLNQNINYLQIPVQVNEEFKTVDLFVKKRQNGSKNQDEMRLLIALDTETTGNVQAFMDWNNNRLKITFRVSTEEVESQYKQHLMALQDSLKETLKKPVFIECITKSEDFPVMSFFKEEERGHGFNAKV